MALTVISRDKSEHPFCKRAHHKTGGNVAYPMRQQQHPRCDQPRADAPNHVTLPRGKRAGGRSQRADVDGMTLPRGKRAGGRSQRADVDGMAGWKCIERPARERYAAPVPPPCNAVPGISL
jgi:hypothetical protein